MSTGDEIETFSLDDVCQMHDISADWLRRRITSGETPAVLAGQSWRMTRSDIAELVEQMREAGQRKIAKLAARRPDAESSAPAESAPAPANAGLSKRSAARLKRPA